MAFTYFIFRIAVYKFVNAINVLSSIAKINIFDQIINIMAAVKIYSCTVDSMFKSKKHFVQLQSALT